MSGASRMWSNVTDGEPTLHTFRADLGDLCQALGQPGRARWRSGLGLTGTTGRRAIVPPRAPTEMTVLVMPGAEFGAAWRRLAVARSSRR